MSDALSRLRLPLLLIALVLLIGGSRFDTLRPVEAQVVALVVPLVGVLSGVSPFFDAHAPLRNAVLALGALVLASAEHAVYGAVFEGALSAPSLARWLVLGIAAVLSVLSEVAGAARGVRSRVSAWFWLAIAFALFFPSHTSTQNLFGSVFGAFLVALFVGGGAGLFMGEFAVRSSRR